MFKSLLMIVLIALLASCATSQYGNHVTDNSSSRNTTIASDAAFQLMQLYPPASTRFNLQHPTTDAFGAVFIENLRMGGYAIQEHIKTNTAPSGSTPDNGTALAYILDQSSDVFRLSVMIDKKILTRAYMPHENKIQPAGSWVLKE
ncbi:MAG: conjugal transfer protein TrbH [Nitrosomonas sp.]|nr:conjugal transfer protein TrbH [Nitrosomonas sp.]